MGRINPERAAVWVILLVSSLIFLMVVLIIRNGKFEEPATRPSTIPVQQHPTPSP